VLIGGDDAFGGRVGKLSPLTGGKVGTALVLPGGRVGITADEGSVAGGMVGKASF
jgi:hypothetical protein